MTIVIASTGFALSRGFSKSYQRVLCLTAIYSFLGAAAFVGSTLVIMKGFTSSMWIFTSGAVWGLIGLAVGTMLEFLKRER
jgi:hypothetical protein